MPRIIACVVAAVALAAAFVLGGCSAGSPKDDAPVEIAVWTYYNGDQLSGFQDLVAEFNETIGAEQGIVVKPSNLGSVNDLQDAVLNSANGKVGADPMPDIFMGYADTVHEIDKMGLIADISPYLTEEERSLYIEDYLREGTMGNGNAIKIFPVAKSVEIFMLNKTDFAPFAAETGTTYDDLATVEGLTSVAERYYEWTDAQTPEPDDGKAFCGRDSLANYFLIGSKQLGVDMLQVQDSEVQLNFDEKVVRKLWDNYYVPYVKGYFDATGRYRSDDIKTGNIIALVGSSASATFFPTQVIGNDGTERSIEMQVLPAPQFKDAQAVAVQQGAGMAVSNATEEEIAASVEFLKWFTAKDQNLRFSVTSSYLPVTKEASSMEAVRSMPDGVDEKMEQVLEVAMAEVESNELYTPPAFDNGAEVRNLLENTLSEQASKDSQAVRDMVAAGTPKDQALQEYLSDDHFKEWYRQVRDQLESLL